MKYKLFVKQKRGKPKLFGTYPNISKLRKDFFSYGLLASNVTIKPIVKKRR